MATCYSLLAPVSPVHAVLKQHILSFSVTQCNTTKCDHALVSSQTTLNLQFRILYFEPVKALCMLMYYTKYS